MARAGGARAGVLAVPAQPQPDDHGGESAESSPGRGPARGVAGRTAGMRRALRRISARAGISLGLVVLIVAIVAVARLTDDPRGPGLFPRFPDATPSVAATEGDD